MLGRARPPSPQEVTCYMKQADEAASRCSGPFQGPWMNVFTWKKYRQNLCKYCDNKHWYGRVAQPGNQQTRATGRSSSCLHFSHTTPSWNIRKYVMLKKSTYVGSKNILGRKKLKCGRCHGTKLWKNESINIRSKKLPKKSQNILCKKTCEKSKTMIDRKIS